MEWLRWYHGAVSDDKWPLIARKSGQTVAVVIAVWAALLECASQAESRESIDALMQLPDGATQAVVDALSEGKRPRIVDGLIANWSKRQPVREREDNDSTERSRRHRERQKALREADNNHSDPDETPCNASATPVKRQETPRTEKIREEKNIKAPPYPPEGGTGDGESSPTSPASKSKAREPTGNSLPELRQAVAEYTAYEPLRKTLEDFRLMRERIRKPMTGQALRLLFRELENLGGNDDALKIAVLEQSILNSWQGVFALKGPVRAGQAAGQVLSKNMETSAAVLAARQQRRQQSEQPL